MIAENPPLVTLLSDLPVVGKPLAALLGPDLTVLINLGYGPDNLGYSLPANVPTEFGLFPDVSPATVIGELAGGAQQGFSAFTDDLQNFSLTSLTSGGSPSLPSMTDLVTALSALSADVSDPAATLTDVAHAFSSAGASLAALGLQTTDIVNAAVTGLVANDVTIFLDNLNNPVDAVGLPLAADTALFTLLGGFEVELVDQALTAVVGDFTALIP